MKKYIKWSVLIAVCVTFASTVYPGTKVADAQVLSCPKTFQRNLQIGSYGSDVVALQDWLIKNGFDIPSITKNSGPKGYFGFYTASALRKYQKAVGLPENGSLGPLTMNKLNQCGIKVDDSVKSKFELPPTPAGVIKTDSPGPTTVSSPASVGNTDQGSTFTIICYPQPTSIPVGGAVLFQVSQSGSYASSYEWSGTDGLSGQGYMVAKRYDTSGTKLAKVTAISSNGQKVVGACTVNVFNQTTSGDSSLSGSGKASEIKSSTGLRGPIVKVTSPANDETWEYGTTQTISWSIGGLDAELGALFTVYLVPQDGRPAITLATNYSQANKSITVNVRSATLMPDGTMKPSKMTPGIYKVKVVCQSNNQPGLKDCSSESTGTVRIPETVIKANADKKESSLPESSKTSE